jgi:hypothetical protein
MCWRESCAAFLARRWCVRAEAATVMFAGKEPMRGGPGYVSDHPGLRARLALART